jgi:hypothetical protein
MYGAAADVRVLAFEPSSRILVDWGTTVEWTFTPHALGTMVAITNAGFTGDDVVAQALDAKGGFSYVLAGLKAWLEHGVELNLVADHVPDAHVR